MDHNEARLIIEELGLSDAALAAALGVSRQTATNWRTGHSGWKTGRMPGIVATALRSLVELRRLEPGNRELPDALRRDRRRLASRGGMGADTLSNDNSPRPLGGTPA